MGPNWNNGCPWEAQNEIHAPSPQPVDKKRGGVRSVPLSRVGTPGEGCILIRSRDQVFQPITMSVVYSHPPSHHIGNTIDQDKLPKRDPCSSNLWSHTFLIQTKRPAPYSPFIFTFSLKSVFQRWAYHLQINYSVHANPNPKDLALS